jgi:hypothetical protein
MVKPSRNDGDLARAMVHHHIHPISSSNRQGAQRSDHDVAVGFIAGVVPISVNKVAAMTELITGSLMFRLTSDAAFGASPSGCCPPSPSSDSTTFSLHNGRSSKPIDGSADAQARPLTGLRLMDLFS